MANTTYLNIEIPDVGADNNTWGTITNAAWNAFDACLRPTGNGTSVGLNVGSGNTLTLAGTGTVTGTLGCAGGTLVLPAATTPAQTAEGSVVWDSDSDLLTVGTGAARKTMVDTDSTQTLTNKTLTTPVFSGTPTGTVTSGTYTPTVANTTNVTSSTPGQFQYLRVGNVVTVSGTVSVTPTLGGVILFTLSLPIASDLAGTTSLAGSAVGNNGGDAISARVYGNSTNDLADVTVPSTGGSGIVLAFHFTYLVA